jgi:hypothetical protein
MTTLIRKLVVGATELLPEATPRCARNAKRAGPEKNAADVNRDRDGETYLVLHTS